MVLFIPSVERDGVTPIDQQQWVDAALEMFGRVFGGATAYPKAKGVWRDDEAGGTLVVDEPVVVHCYTTPAAIESAANLAELGSFCRRMGREARREKSAWSLGTSTSPSATSWRSRRMKTQLDMDKIARGLGAQRRGKVTAPGGYFGALQLLAEVKARFRVPAGGGRPTDPRWTERRLVPLAPRTLERLEEITAKVREHGVANLEPMQLAALLLEKTTEQLSRDEAEELVRTQRRASR